ncbi:MAG TPA: ankyrin repeat domain-containing protein [Acetobacteraceae bacterium]|nr:ankyrin repeat domain-containing protein [Acetobacteraceae bacterium]
MQNRLLHASVLASAMALAVAGLGATAHAQLSPGPGGMIDPNSLLRQGAAMAPKTEGAAPVSRPPALPGAASRSDAAAPATRNPADMSPNDALFDAINRGDIAAARDAMNRGAELSAHNVLGMTPMELSVDLGRNDISFLLLSYRTADTPNGPPTAQAKATQAAAPPDTVARSRAHANVIPVRATVPAAPRTPRLFANDGGAPVPNAGFLGFGGAQAQR